MLHACNRGWGTCQFLHVIIETSHEDIVLQLFADCCGNCKPASSPKCFQLCKFSLYKNIFRVHFETEFQIRDWILVAAEHLCVMRHLFSHYWTRVNHLLGFALEEDSDATNKNCVSCEHTLVNIPHNLIPSHSIIAELHRSDRMQRLKEEKRWAPSMARCMGTSHSNAVDFKHFVVSHSYYASRQLIISSSIHLNIRPGFFHVWITPWVVVVLVSRNDVWWNYLNLTCFQKFNYFIGLRYINENARMIMLTTKPDIVAKVIL